MTLLEMLISLSIVGLVLGGLASAVLVASHALPDRQPELSRRRAATEALNQLASDLAFATTVSAISNVAVTFTVADRGHGGAGAETISYSWSGVEGDPLTRTYNSNAALTLVEGVKSLTLTPATGVREISGPPRVLVMVGAVPILASSDDETRKNLLLSWDFTVTEIDDADTLANFNTAAAAADVIYVGEDASWLVGWNKWYNIGRGVVIEETVAIGSYQMAGAFGPLTDSTVQISNNTHPITALLALNASVSITTSSQLLNEVHESTVADHAVALATKVASPKVRMLALEHAGTQTDGEAARARRVVMPWGGESLLAINFPFSSLTADSKTLLRRALTWAAARVVLQRVRVQLELTDGLTPLETEVLLLAAPEDPRL